MLLSVGKSDGDEHDQSKQGPDGGHGRWPADAGRPAPQGRTAEGFPGEDPRLGPSKASVYQPCSGPSFHPGESLNGHWHIAYV